MKISRGSCDEPLERCYEVLVDIDGVIWSLDAFRYLDACVAEAVAAEARGQGLDAWVDPVGGMT